MMTQIASATNRGDEQTKSAGKCGQIYGAPPPEYRALRANSMTPVID
jgi:hypothetical protein